MMNTRIKAGLRAFAFLGVATLIGVATSGCDSFFEVDAPNLIDAETLDPVSDADLFSRSALQTFASAYGAMIVYGGWFSNEAWVGDTFPTRNEFGRRAVDFTNGTLNGDVWFPLARSVRQGEEVLDLVSGQGTELSVARGALTSAFGLTLMAEAFCEGTMWQPGDEPGPLMTTEDLLETAVDRFDRAISQATAAGGGEATGIANAARVGMGRALLQLGRNSEAVQAVQEVSDDFVFNLPFVDDPGNRARLGNGVFFFSQGGSRVSLVVPPHYREIGQDLTGNPLEPEGDPRVQFFDAQRNAQDNTLRLWSQLKFDNWAAPIDLASGLEARYIEVEARNDPAEMRAFINERREVGGHGPYEGDDLLGELMAQRSIDFWLTARRMGDWRRNPGAVPNILPPGPYYKEALPDVQDQTCWPIPFNERQHNPNLPRP